MTKNCFYCGSHRTIKKGKEKDYQRWFCKDCKRYFGSSVKCVDTFRIALKEEPKSCVKQIDEGVSKLRHPLILLNIRML